MSLGWADAVRYAERVVERHGRGDAFARLLAQDEVLVRAGFPPLSPWWRERLGEFYAGRRLRAVFRVGRRGGKSSTMCRVAVAEALGREWPVTPGDKGVFAFFSVTTGEASNRLDTVRAILVALGLREGYDFVQSTDRTGPFLRLEDRPIWFRALSANFRTAVGFTCIGFVADELARWHDERTGRNPASHVLASVRPAMSTMLAAGAHEFLISSPWSEFDAHFDAFEKGEDADQLVGHAETWVANPSLDEALCRRLAAGEAEGGEDADFDREYRAIPMPSTAEALFDSAAVDEAVLTYPLGCTAPEGSLVVAAADFGFTRDHSALVVAYHVAERYRMIDRVELRPEPGSPLRPSAVVASFAEKARVHGVGAVMADAHYRESILEHLEAHGLSLVDAPADVAAPFVRFKTLLHQQRIVLPNDVGIVRDLKRIRAKPLPTGRIRIVLPKDVRGGHADTVSALVLAVWQKGGHAVGTSRPQSDLEREEAAMRERSMKEVKREREGWISEAEDDEDAWQDPLDDGD